MIIQTYRKYRFGSSSGLSTKQMERLAKLFKNPPEQASAVLGGRIQPHFQDLAEWGPVVIKHYFRGGIIRHFNRRTYLRLARTRSHAEFDLLTRLRETGINAPEPVVFAERGRLFYRAWLVTRKIPEALTLADLSRSAPGRAEAAMPAVLEQIRRLIDGGILHLDLHPGNVLIDARGKAFVIDLDKAKTGRKNRERLLRRYQERWERAVTKYGLPRFLNETMHYGPGTD